MSKRFATTCFIVLACVLIACFAFIIALFMLPGVSIFGLKYIGKGTHGGDNIAQNNFENGVEKSPVYLSVQKLENGEEIGEFSGIILNCYEIPVKVCFSKYAGHWKIKYEDNYNGITNSKIKDPSVTYQKDDAGNVVINVSEYHTFLYESAVSSRCLELYLPFQELTEDQVQGFNLEINSYKSPVSFKNEDEDLDEICAATFNNLFVTTNGEVTCSYLIDARNYKLSTSKTIEIKSDDKIQATNYDLTSTDGKIVITKEIVGDVVANTTLGKVLLKSCNNLTATTTFGDVGYSGNDDGKVTVNGIAKISTRAGNVTLGSVKGDSGKSSIITTSGNVKVDSIIDGTVSTQRGKITIDSVHEVEATSKTGKIYVQEVQEKLTAKTTRSKIIVGGTSLLVKNLDLYSTLGDINVQSTIGSVKIETDSGDIDFVNELSSEIEIDCGGSLSAENLIGNVHIKVDRFVRQIEFNDLTQGDVDIELGDGCTSAYVYINHDSFENVSYMVQGASVAIQEYKNAEWQGSGTISKNYDVLVSNNSYHFTMYGNNANIVLRFS